MKTTPIIAVKNVPNSSLWYQTVFGLRSKHGGNEFDVLLDQDGEVQLCLHKWGTHEHPTMQSTNTRGGNGLILYFRTDNLEGIKENLRRLDYDLEQEMELSPNSHRREFSLRDPDGYYLTVAEHHEFEG